MKTIGLLGGMSWESTVTYYRLINEGIKNKLGGLHSAKICLYSVDFDEIEHLQHQGRWDQAAEILSLAARNIQAGGADFLLICTNTMHKIAPEIQRAVSIPLLHIADAMAEELIRRGIRSVGLLGTRFTMEEEFYRGRLRARYGLTIHIPEPDDRELVHAVIYEELCLGKLDDKSRLRFLEIIKNLRIAGAEGVILGCTEIALLVNQEMTDITLFDTTAIHASRAVEWALAK